ncbi:MAG: alpha-L-rhamnosidase-related protein [Planctomycetota bacterium]|jgi:hypothetical protein
MRLESNEKWLSKAEEAKPVLHEAVVDPVGLITVLRDAEGFQGWTSRPSENPAALADRPLRRGDTVIFDFGEHLVGRLELALRPLDAIQDAPVRLRLTFGEVLSEVAEPLEEDREGMAATWLQDEFVTVDWLPGQVDLPRRFAFRYLRLTVVALSGPIVFSSCRCRTVTSADPAAIQAATSPTPSDPDLAAIAEVSLRTLKNCMQTVFEDGPKRDRRLWVGDLRLQALANYASFNNTDLVRRCLYLFAALPNPDGLISACVYESPHPVCGGLRLLPYAALFNTTLLEYAEHSGDWDTARDLWPVARRQIPFLLDCIDEEGLFQDPGNYWLFVDWATFNTQASMQAIIILVLRHTLRLAKHLGCMDETDDWEARLEIMVQAARCHLRNHEGLITSGTENELSLASAAWMILADVLTPEEGRTALQGLSSRSDVVQPVSPYLHHYIVEAMIHCGLESDAVAWLKEYWGAMLARGATTFWEVYDSEDESLSPYGDVRVNSYCHAWSCTPIYLLTLLT